MCARTWYIYRKFQHIACVVPNVPKRSWESGRAQDNLANLKYFMIGTSVMVSLIVTTCAMFIGFDGSRPVTHIIKIAGVNVEITQCAYRTNNRLLIAQGCYMMVIFLFGFTYSYLSRSFPDTISGGRVLFTVILLSCVVMILTVVTVDSVKGFPHYVLAQTVGISSAVLIGLSLLFFPTVYKMMTIGDLTAKKDYIEDVVNSVSNSGKGNKSLMVLPSRKAVSKKAPLHTVKSVSRRFTPVI
jgi:hypothetical protein